MVSLSEYGIVIVGGGISGLSTALALHRKGIKSIVLERSDELRATGAAINVLTNGWRALDQLGIGPELRQKAIRLSKFRDVFEIKEREVLLGKDELRSLKRSDLINALADSLPSGTIRLGQQIVSVELDTESGFPILHCIDGTTINCKILIGCDGVNSTVAKSLGLKAPTLVPVCGIRAFTSYPNGHGFTNDFTRIKRGTFTMGVVPRGGATRAQWGQLPPLTHHLLTFLSNSIAQHDNTFLRDLTADMMKGLPEKLVDMVRKVDLDSLSLTCVRKGTTIVVGDAMHVIGPYIGQGGSVCMEDAVVLARRLAGELQFPEGRSYDFQWLRTGVEKAMDGYLRERKPRLLRLSLEAYLMGLMYATPFKILKIVIMVALVAFFGHGALGHAQYDCGFVYEYVYEMRVCRFLEENVSTGIRRLEELIETGTDMTDGAAGGDGYLRLATPDGTACLS
ncbi:hypothetical protein QJS10_CPB13g01093 [Acorus calamus]|uniref:FAD-binding domain-containing protein n=1 Tax=Acorus calamus TaxID=4465 RepID=A0AAV9DE46_ACOCL|nr:hypothetical protein QJS10_CPB13g01093 [Acorus calamus]